MKTHLIIYACLVSLAIAADGLLAEDQAREAHFPTELTDSTLREGLWIWRSGHHVPSMEIQEVVRVRRSEDKWDLTLFTLSHTRESFRTKQPPHLQMDGPYPISVTNGVIHIQKPYGVLKYSCRFHGELLQFPAITRPDTNTFNFTVSELSTGRDRVDTWSYIWVCSSNPSVASTGTASVVLQSPKKQETISCTYSVVDHHDGPALVFSRRIGTRDGEDRIVWHRKVFGPQIYRSDAAQLDRPGLQKTYRPVDDSIRPGIQELIEQEPNKPDARDGL